MKLVVGHIYANTKELMAELVSNLGDYEIAYENEQKTSATIIKEVNDEQAD